MTSKNLPKGPCLPIWLPELADRTLPDPEMPDDTPWASSAFAPDPFPF